MHLRNPGFMQGSDVPKMQDKICSSLEINERTYSVEPLAKKTSIVFHRCGGLTIKRLWKSERRRSLNTQVSESLKMESERGGTWYIYKLLFPFVLRASSLVPEDHIVVPPR